MRRGGVSGWAAIAREIKLLLRDTSITRLTTVLDYYGIPADTPGMADRPITSAWTRVSHVERAMAVSIEDPRFVPNLTLHESETWVFAAAEQLATLLNLPDLGKALRADVARAGGPEQVNDGPASAPSKRLLRYYPAYNKRLDGPLAIGELGLPGLRRQCPHLDAWLARLETLTPPG